ncbi:PQQ-binding-like beta-propeller repeat protein [Sphingomonas sp. 3P27F8]|uniref:outer membrane protein assembly factor BamB family protein n=1 Tax=Sphingomonas sp. 3P27F8 TaxID=2502213 RepID=UPI0010F78678|nr:PQQ-binding-like beta-propeller repeat protein [Sphingomonas sp. 3P27F8]
MRYLGILSVAVFVVALASGGKGASTPTPAVDVGRKAYADNCAACHGDSMGGRFAPPLKGSAFVAKWGKKPVDALADYIRKSMPPANPGKLSPATYTALARLLRSANGLASASGPDKAVAAGETAATKPEGRALSVSGLVDDPFVKAHDERMRALAARLRPVSDDMLSRPADADWPTWRRSRSLNGFTPLSQIDKGNVAKLGVAWSLSLKPGTNGFEPLAQDGILFVNAGGEIQALDGTSGDVVWEYSLPIAQAAIPLTQSRGMTLYKGNLYIPTLDAHMLALDARTGKLLWDHAIKKTAGQSFILTGAPTAVNGKIIQGVSGCFGQSNPGGCFIVGLDAGDGRELWRFNTIARPGDSGGSSWNGAPLAGRFGGSVWSGGSYDPDLNLVYFGVGQTYKITTLLNLNPAAAGSTRDALYTDSTLALNPDTGALVWHYQHLAGDVWDFDWSFERALITMAGPAGPRKVIVTAGKIGIVDALDARTGDYLWSADLGVQSLITAIDAKTGRKTTDQKLIPVKGEMRTVCPSALGGRNWLASAVDPQRRLVFYPLLEACMDIGLESSETLGDFKLVTRPRPDSDGKFGRVLALDLESHKFKWVDRMRAAPASAMLATSGGVVFEGSRDRWFRARAQDTGDVLWKTRLDDGPNGFPISYAAEGRQYVAVVTGGNTPFDLGIRGLTPEIRSSPGSRTLWVFALPKVASK